MIWRLIGVALVLWVAAAAGCAPKAMAPDLGGLYNRPARYHDAQRNPVIVIPGLLGSKLEDKQSGRVVWGAFTGEYANPEKPEGARLIALPMREGSALTELRDDVIPRGVLERVRARFFRIPLEQKAYLYILGTLGVGGYRDEDANLSGDVDYGEGHFTCFQFDYDWRRDNVENARRLHEFILEKRAYVQSEILKRYGVVDADVKFDLIAHSMGGLLTRYYLRYGAADLPADGSVPVVTWAGSRYVERAILIAPPNAGSAETIVHLVRGTKFARFLPRYEPAVIGTMPSIYQLLPRSRHGALVEGATGKPVEDILSPELWKRMGWGLASPGQDRVLRMLLPDVTDAAVRRCGAASRWTISASLWRGPAGSWRRSMSPPDHPEGSAFT